MRTSNGCWTCRVRRKKCDENHPICEACAALCITCHFNQDDKPEWMDGGMKQEEMAVQLKREVKEKTNHRREEHVVLNPGDHGSLVSTIPGGLTKETMTQLADPTYGRPEAIPDISTTETEVPPQGTSMPSKRGTDCTLISRPFHENIAFGRSESILLAFYLEHLLPFLFPFYRPSILDGGRAWIFEMMISSPVVRQATLCQSSFFFSLARGTANPDVAWDTVLAKITDAFRVLRQALQVIDGSDIADHLHGAVRIMSSIMQMQRFEVAVLSFDNWQTHLNAALVLFEQIFNSTTDVGEPGSMFEAVIHRLGPSSPSLSCPSGFTPVPSAEQAAFRFSSALVVMDDVLASTALQQQPKLYELHRSLLESIEGNKYPPIDLEAVVGLKNWILIQIGEIAALQAWKLRCRTSGNLDVVELVHRAKTIRESLADRLMRLDTDPPLVQNEHTSLLDAFTPPPGQTSVVSRVWAHAALIYLYVVVSGWQPASIDVRYHVSQVIELLKHDQSPVLLRTMVWPFCIVGCFAEPAQEAHFRRMVEVLQPPSLFGTVHKALQIMENVWRDRHTTGTTHELATCFTLHGEIVLLI